jgi:hypothetical protein
MSSRLLADIRRLEEPQQDFRPRSVESALRLWTRHLGNPLEARHLLRRAVSALPAPTAKELRRFVAKAAELHAAEPHAA